jgi:hypothetical protein
LRPLGPLRSDWTLDIQHLGGFVSSAIRFRLNKPNEPGAIIYTGVDDRVAIGLSSSGHHAANGEECER